MVEAALKFAAELAAKLLNRPATQLFRHVFYKDGKFRLNRFLRFWLAVAFGVGFWWVPRNIVDPGSGRLRYIFDAPLPSWLSGLADPAFATLASIFLLASLFLILTIVALVVVERERRRMFDKARTSPLTISRAREVGLIGIYRWRVDEDRQHADKLLLKLIDQSDTLRIAMINGYTDFYGLRASVRSALEHSDKNNKRVMLLLLDPYSRFAKKRAEDIYKEYEVEHRHLKLIRDFLLVQSKLVELRRTRGHQIDVRLYCAIPRIRLFLFEEDALVQSYYSKERSWRVPMYHFRKANRSAYGLLENAFDDMWDDGHETFSERYLQSTRRVFVVARNHGVTSEDVDGNPSIHESVLELSQKILSRIERLNRRATTEDMEKLFASKRMFEDT